MSNWIIGEDGVRIQLWPPRMEHDSAKARFLMEAHLREAASCRAAALPVAVWDLGHHTAMGWRVPYIFYYGGERAMDYYHRCPAALVALGRKISNAKEGIRLIKRACCGNDLDFLFAIGLPRSRAVFNILTKITAAAWSGSLIERAVRCWKHYPRPRAWLQHIPVITLDVIGLLRQHDKANWALIEQASRSLTLDVSDALYTLEQAWSLWQREAKRTDPWPYGNIRYEHIADATNRLVLRRKHKAMLPDPPLPPAGNIYPITSLEDLYEEGREMGNCIFGFAASIEAGAAYTYSLRRPKCRCTVLLTRGYAGVWAVTEMKAWHNSECSIQAREEVEAWASHHQPMVEPERTWQVSPINAGEEWDEDGDFDPKPLSEDERIEWPGWDDEGLPF